MIKKVFISALLTMSSAVAFSNNIMPIEPVTLKCGDWVLTFIDKEGQKGSIFLDAKEVRDLTVVSTNLYGTQLRAQPNSLDATRNIKVPSYIQIRRDPLSLAYYETFSFGFPDSFEGAEEEACSVYAPSY